MFHYELLEAPAPLPLASPLPLPLPLEPLLELLPFTVVSDPFLLAAICHAGIDLVAGRLSKLNGLAVSLFGAVMPGAGADALVEADATPVAAELFSGLSLEPFAVGGALDENPGIAEPCPLGVVAPLLFRPGDRD